MQNLAPLGLLIAAGITYWSLSGLGTVSILWNAHGLAEVIGFVLCVGLINYPYAQLKRSAVWLVRLLQPSPVPSEREVARELLRLARVAQTQGGLLALQDEGKEVAEGFLNRAILVAIASGERDKARDILDADIRQAKLQATEDSNVYRTLGTMAPMFGLLGTLLGIILVLRNLSDPAKVGPSMSLAITASLYGIAFANLICIPVAGHIRTRSLDEARVRELIVDGVLDLMSGDSAYLLELRLAPYLSETPGGAAPRETEAATP